MIFSHTGSQHSLDVVFRVAQDDSISLLLAFIALCLHGLDMKALEHWELDLLAKIRLEDRSEMSGGLV
jgi:hypothetical protein